MVEKIMANGKTIPAIGPDGRSYDVPEGTNLSEYGLRPAEFKLPAGAASIGPTDPSNLKPSKELYTPGPHDPALRGAGAPWGLNYFSSAMGADPVVGPGGTVVPTNAQKFREAKGEQDFMDKQAKSADPGTYAVSEAISGYPQAELFSGIGGKAGDFAGQAIKEHALNRALSKTGGYLPAAKAMVAPGAFKRQVLPGAGALAGELAAHSQGLGPVSYLGGHIGEAVGRKMAGLDPHVTFFSPVKAQVQALFGLGSPAAESAVGSMVPKTARIAGRAGSQAQTLQDLGEYLQQRLNEGDNK
jgi:hypothetical protein